MSCLELMSTRRTYRRFLQKPLPQEVIAAVQTAAQRSSSASNRQALRYVWVRQPQAVAQANALVKWAGALPPEQGTPKPDERPTAFLAVLGNGGAMDQVDAGIAMANMTLAAWELGVGSCIMGAINRPALQKLLQLPGESPLLYMVAFGYPAHQSTLAPFEGSCKYYLDEQRDYHVPRRKPEELFAEWAGGERG